VLLTLPVREVLPATPRSRLVRIDLAGHHFPYRAGQAVFVAEHDQGRRKPYSLAGAPEDAAREGVLELLVGVDSSSGSPLQVEAGTLLDVQGPVGRFTFPVEPPERHLVFIAGGTGIAPLRAMLRHALRVPRFIIGLLYSARTPGDFAFEEEFRQLAREGRIALRQTVTREIESEGWTGTRGRIGRGDLAPLVRDRETLCFVCGPPALVEDLPKMLAELGVPRERIRIEEWSSA
jgi:ferredoxin-NADP reductase